MKYDIINNSLTNNNYNINITQQLINYIYSTIELSKFKYKIIEFESDLHILTKQKHFISANFNGTNCLLVFIKLRDKFYSFLVDRKTLTYNQNQVKINNVKITSVNIRLDNNIYNGTIFDGIYIQNKKTNGKIYVITDVYYFNGKNLIDDDLKYKFMNITAYLESNLKVDDKLNNLKLTINKLYEPTEISKLIVDMDKSKGFDFKGFIFYPIKSGTKLIFLNNEIKINKNINYNNLNNKNLNNNNLNNKNLNNNNLINNNLINNNNLNNNNLINNNNLNNNNLNNINLINNNNLNNNNLINNNNLNNNNLNNNNLNNNNLINNNNLNNNNLYNNNLNNNNLNNNNLDDFGKSLETNNNIKINKKKKYTYICKTNEPIYAILEVRKSMSPDVYNVYCIDNEIINGKNYLKLKKLGIALIPDINCSIICKNIFNSKLNGKALMNCKFNSDKNKWIPIDENKQSKQPDLLSEIVKNLEIIIESDNDDDD